MKLIIAGGRDYLFFPSDLLRLNRLSKKIEIEEVVSGCARGADTEGENWAKSLSIPVKLFPANWDKFGKSAGFIRNTDMAEYADGVVLFPGGRGTEHMFRVGLSNHLEIYDWR